jgi:hemerythrin-like domain-containing protein
MLTPNLRQSRHLEGDALDFLRAQHREIDRLLAALVQTPLASDKRRLLGEAADFVAVHFAVEERVFYPGLRSEVVDAAGAPFAAQDHGELKRLVAELLASDVEAKSFAVLSRLVRERAAAHAASEEKRVFPQLRRRVSHLHLRRLEYQMRVLEFQLRTDTVPRQIIIADAVASVSA